MIEAELFDGTVLEFPDGTSQEVIQNVVKQQTQQRRQSSGARLPSVMDRSSGAAATAAPVQGPMQPEAPPEEEDWLTSLITGAGNLAYQGARGAATGLTNIVGLPGTIGKGINSLAQMAAEKAGAPESVVNAAGYINPVGHLWPTGEDIMGYGDSVTEALSDKLGVEPPRKEPSGPAERFVNRVGEEVGAMALPAVGVMGLAARKGLPAIREGSRMSRMFLEPAAVNPAKFLAKETAVATGAGTGAAIANMAVDRNTTAGQVADVVGALTGATATGLASSMTRGTSELIGALFNRSSYVDDVVRDAVVDRLSEAAGLQTAIGQAPDTAPLVEAIEAGPRIGRVVPGVQETLADRTKNPGIASLEYSRQTGPNSGLFNTRRQNNAAAIDNTLTSMAPEGSGSQLLRELELERGRRLMDADTMARNAAEDAWVAVEPLRPQGTAAERGNTIRSALDEAREAARTRTREAYEQSSISGQQITPEALIDVIDGTVGRMTQAEQSRLPTALLDRIRTLGDAGGATMKEATDLRSELLELSRAAAAKPDGRNEARVLADLERAVDDFITTNISPDERQALEAARAARFDEAERFDRPGDPVNRALSQYPGGQPRMRDENVARTFTNTQNMDRLLAQADTPEVRSAIRNELLSGADTSRPDRIESFIATNGEQIDRFPGLREELTRAAQARTAEQEAAQRLSTMERELGTPERRGTSTVGKYLNYGDAQSQRAIREVVNAPDPAKAADELLDFVGDSPAAVAGARKTFWDYMESQTRRSGETTAGVDGRQPWMPKNLKAFLDDPKNRAVAERFYRDNPEHVENMRIIAEALQGLDTRNAGRVPNTSGTAQGILPSAETVGSRLFAYQRGQVGGTWLITSLAAVAGRRAVRGARGEAIERMLDQALLDPDGAALLLRDNNPANREALRRKAKLWFGNEANTIMNALSGEEQEDDTMEAIGGR